MPTQSISAAQTPIAEARSLSSHLVVTYHYIRENNSDGVTGLTPAAFAAQVRAIRSRYRIVSAETFAASHCVEENLALITFDDALCDQLTAAAILDDMNLPGVFFAPMRPFSDEDDRWCAQHLLHALAENLGWEELEQRAAAYLRNCDIDEARMNALYHYEVPRKRRLKYALAFAVDSATAANILRRINADIGLSPDDWFMSREELNTLQSAGHDLGGHGFDHVPYAELSDEQQEADMARAAQTMEQHFGRRPRPLAYPFGRFNAVTESLAKRFGYTMTFDTVHRVDAKFLFDELAKRERQAQP